MISRNHVVGAGEQNDCFVQSLAHALGCSYATAEHQARIYGIMGIGSRGQNDCFVQSLANLLGCSYATAEHQARIYGYTPTRGMAIRGLIPAFDKLAPCYTLRAYGYTGRVARYFRKQISCQLHDEGLSLKTWLAHNQQGTFAVLQKDHIFVVVDGVVHDNNAPKRGKMVNATFEFTGLAKSVPQ